MLGENKRINYNDMHGIAHDTCRDTNSVFVPQDIMIEHEEI
jgi:hypothetical protein